MEALGRFDITGEIALVTGASSGLGRRFAKVLAVNGARVVLIARRTERLNDLKQEIETAGGAALPIEADVTDRAAMKRAFDEAERAFGTVTILVNNAGIARSRRAVELSHEDWKLVMSTNLDAVVFWSQEAARRLFSAKKAGKVINIASVLSFGNVKGAAAYSAAKAAVVQITKTLALEWSSKGVRVNAIAPGWFVTEMNEEYLRSDEGQAIKRGIPLGRFGMDGDLDGALLLLASDAGAFFTGSIIVVDGGLLAAM